MDVYGIVYLLIDGTNDKEYVGQTMYTFEKRFNEHKCGDQYIDRAIRKRGVEMFATAILKVCYSREELDYWERRLIKSRDTLAPNGYNLTEGGEGGSPCEETKAKISAAVIAYNEAHPEIHEIISEAGKRRYSDPVEREKAAERTRKVFENPEIAAKHAESQRRRFERQEERDKISAAVTERFSDPAEREAQSERIKAYFDTPGARERNGESQSKRFEDPAERKKVSDGLKNYYAEHPEAAAAISARTKGRQDSDETRERKSRGQKARQARERLERLPLLVAQQNRAAARWNSLPPAMENFRIEQLGDIEKIFADAKRLKEKRRSAKRRARKKLQSIAAEKICRRLSCPRKSRCRNRLRLRHQ
ncbi:MAG: GIY-YIG nuclease family protein [Selenomonadaceae bacterium]|nr:GIY-YIG nuclease family protein [Selenomonadaceae bacterium]